MVNNFYNIIKIFIKVFNKNKIFIELNKNPNFYKIQNFIRPIKIFAFIHIKYYIYTKYKYIHSIYNFYSNMIE